MTQETRERINKARAKGGLPLIPDRPAKDPVRSAGAKRMNANMTPEQKEKQTAHLRSIVAKSNEATKALFTIDPPANAAEVIRQASENGCTTKQIAGAFGVSRGIFDRWVNDYPDIAAAYRDGRKVEHDVLVGALYGAAIKGNITAAIFLLKARHGYTDQGGVVVENRVSINFQLPAALSPEEYVRSIAATAEAVPPEKAARLLADGKVKKALRDERL
jgi:hypothetical protein